MNRAFFKLALVFGTIYFVQGMGNLPGLPIQYLLKNVLKLDEAQAQFFSAATMVAWLVKPIWGYLSDTFPIMGYRRKSYLIGMSLAAAGSWFLLAWMAHSHDYRYWGLLILFNISSAAYAFVDVVCDGLMVEEGKRKNLIDRFVNIQWFGMGVAGVITGLVSGKLAAVANTHLDFYPYIFMAAGAVPLLTAVLVLFFLSEERTTAPFPWRRLMVTLGVFVLGVALLLYNMNPSLSWSLYGWVSGLTVGKRIGLVFCGFLAASYFVWRWAGKPRFFWPISLFIFLWGFNPSVGMASFYYKSDVLKFSEQFMGVLGSIDSICFVLGIMLYGVMLTRFPSLGRKSYLYFSIFVGALGLGVHFLYYLSPATSVFGVSLGFKVSLWGAALTSYHVIALVSAVFFTLLGMAGWLAPLAIAGDAAKEGNEAVTYAWFMSVANFAGTMSSLIGGWLYQELQHANLSSLAFMIGTGDFLGAAANKVLLLRLFVWVSALFTLLAIPLVSLMRFPKEK